MRYTKAVSGFRLRDYNHAKVNTAPPEDEEASTADEEGTLSNCTGGDALRISSVLKRSAKPRMIGKCPLLLKKAEINLLSLFQNL